MVDAYASANQLVLGLLKNDTKSNEITAILARLQTPDLRVAIVMKAGITY